MCGTFWGKKGPVISEIATDPIYIDVSVPPRLKKTLPVETTRHAAYVFAGSGNFVTRPVRLRFPPKASDGRTSSFRGGGQPIAGVVFDRGDEVTVEAGETESVSCQSREKPLQEPVAWYGPIVMNTQEELREAF